MKKQQTEVQNKQNNHYHFSPQKQTVIAPKTGLIKVIFILFIGLGVYTVYHKPDNNLPNNYPISYYRPLTVRL